MVIQLIEPSGAPAPRAASFITSATRVMHLTAAGCGLMHDGTPRLEGNQNLVDGGGRGIGGRYDARDDAEGLGNLDDLAIVEPLHDADGLHRPDELVDLLGREEILLDLVVDDAVAGFFGGKPGERFSLRGDGRRHGVDVGVDLILSAFGEGRGSRFRAARERLALPQWRRGRDRSGPGFAPSS